MRKQGLTRYRKSFSVVVCFLTAGISTNLGAVAALAQQPAVTDSAVTMPSDPKELLLLAAKSNGLGGPDMKPWHLKASFEIVDKSGNATDEGSLEELWASEHKWKQIVTISGRAKTTFNTDRGTFEVGTLEPASSLLGQIANGWLTPMPTEAQIGRFDLSAKPVDMGGIKLNCVIAQSKEGAPIGGHMYCFNGEKPALRMSVVSAPVTLTESHVMRAIFNKTTIFENRFVASSLNVHSSDGSSISGQIEGLELLPSVEEAEFTPPPDAKLVPKQIAISAAVAQGFLLHHVSPEYPSAARDARMSGTVVIEAIIGKDGHIRDAKVVSGAKVFQGAALEAVRHWEYRPYMLNGEPVDVNTTINIVFNLNP
jgi:TonB family protein